MEDRRSFADQPWHLVLLPLLFVAKHLFTVASPVGSGFWAWVFNFLSAVAICSSVSLVLYWLIHRWSSVIKSAIIATIISFGFFFFQDILISSQQLAVTGLRARWALPVLCLALLAFCFYVLKTKSDLRHLNQFLTVVLLALSIYTAFEAVRSEKRSPRHIKANPTAREVKCVDCPDIYFIVLDSYTSNASLEKYFGYNNTPFVEKLSDMGFLVPHEAFSRYTETMYSIGATLNFDEISDLRSYSIGLDDVLRNNSVVKSLQTKNYQIESFSIFEVADKSYFYSITPNLPWVLNGIAQSSILNLVIYDINLKSTIYETHLTIIDRVRDLAQSPSPFPKFVYAHLLIPHPPFAMDSLGNAIGFFQQSQSALNTGSYVQQVTGINLHISRLIEDIVALSPQATIIIMGDHGYRFLDGDYGSEEAKTVFLAYKGPNQEMVLNRPVVNEIFRFALP